MSTSSNLTTESPRKLKILMLHGYTQSGTLFHAKTRALEKILTKAIPAIPPSLKNPPPGSITSYPGGVQLLYPTGPRRLRPSDIPGFESSNLNGLSDDSDTDSWGWWQRDSGTGEYTGLNEGMKIIADTIEEAGGIDGVIGFSQGAAGAAFVASLLEPGRIQAFENLRKEKGGIEYPSSFLVSRESTETINPPLKFAVSYSGFYAPNPLYAAFYEPKIKTPVLHVIGSLDSVVEEERSLALIQACENERVVYHPGGHFVPIGKEMAGALVAFIRETCAEPAAQESVEDTNVPF